MRHGTADFLQVAQVRFDAYALECHGIGIDAQHGAVQLDVRAGPPGMAVGTGAEDIGVLSPGGQAHRDVLPPGVQPVQIPVPQAGFHIRLVEVELVIDGALGQGLVGQELLRHRLRVVHDAAKDGERIGMLAVLVLFDAVGKKAFLLVPIGFFHALREFRGLGFVGFLRPGIAPDSFHFGHHPEGIQELQVHEDGAAVGPSPGRAVLPVAAVVHPVGEVPTGKVPYAAVRQLIPGEIVQNLLRTGHEVQHELRIPAVHQIVVHRIDVTEGIGLDVLGNGRGITALGNAVGTAGDIGQIEEVLYQTVVLAVEKGNQRLDAGIAQILQALIIRTVHVGFRGTEPSRAPADVQDVLQFLPVRVQAGVPRERIAGESAGNPVHGQGFIPSFHHQPHIAESAPGKGGELLVLRTVGNEDILPADEHLPFRLVAVALADDRGDPHKIPVFLRDIGQFLFRRHLPRFGGRDIQGLRVADPHPGALAAAHPEVEISIGQHFVVQQDLFLRMGRDRERVAERERRPLHLWKRGGTEPMPGRLLGVQDVHGLTPVPFPGRQPGRQVGIGLFPVRNAGVHVHLLTGTGHIVAVHMGLQRAVRGILDAFPGLVRHEAGRFPLPLEQETRFHGKLRIRFARALMIHQGHDYVLSGPEAGRQVHRLVVPMGQITLGRAQGHQLLIDKQFVPVIARHMHDIAARDGREVDVLPEIIDAIVLRAGPRDADPAGVPGSGFQIERSGAVLCGRLREGTGKGKKKKNWMKSHGTELT